MEGLQRSTTSFRRQGSSGLVWDDKGDLNRFRNKKEADDVNKQKVAAAMMQRSQSEGGAGRGRMHRAMKEQPPAMDPPSPRVAGCGFCGFFGKPANAASAAKTFNPRNKRASKTRL